MGRAGGTAESVTEVICIARLSNGIRIAGRVRPPAGASNGEDLQRDFSYLTAYSMPDRIGILVGTLLVPPSALPFPVEQIDNGLILSLFGDLADGPSVDIADVRIGAPR